MADRGKLRPFYRNPGKGISTVSIEIPLLSTSLPSPKVSKRDLREKKRVEITSPPRREPDISDTLTLFLGERWSSLQYPLPPGKGSRPDLVAATGLTDLNKLKFFHVALDHLDRLTLFDLTD